MKTKLQNNINIIQNQIDFKDALYFDCLFFHLLFQDLQARTNLLTNEFRFVTFQ